MLLRPLRSDLFSIELRMRSAKWSNTYDPPSLFLMSDSNYPDIFQLYNYKIHKEKNSFPQIDIVLLSTTYVHEYI
jgi:hypothetical protein